MSVDRTYPVGLVLQGRRVVVVGGGQVAQRRIPALLAAGARVRVVAPELTPALEDLAGRGDFDHAARRFRTEDLDDAWYVLAATSEPAVNAEIVVGAEERRIFCVRADDAAGGTAWTPAVGRHGDVTVAVLGDRGATRDPRRTARVRDRLLGVLEGEPVPGVGAEPEQETTAAHGSRPPAGVRAGEVVLVGGGPGDPELISVAGRQALRAADVVVADRLAPQELLGELSGDTELIDVAKLPRGRSAHQDDINAVIVERALAGKRVVRFKGGDNFVFGRGFEEVLACREAGVPVRVIPGLSSALAVPAVAGIPVTHRGVAHEFTVVSGHLSPDSAKSLVDWSALARLRGTLVLLMAVLNAPEIARRLIEGGRAPGTPVAIVCEGTLASQRRVITDLASLGEDLRRHRIEAPAIIVVGEVVGLAAGIDG